MTGIGQMTMLSSERLELSIINAKYLEEIITISPSDANKIGIYESVYYCLFVIEPLYPGPPPEAYAARLLIDENTSVGCLKINEHFLASMGIKENEDRLWSIQIANRIVTVEKAILEFTVEQDRIGKTLEYLERRRRNIFSHRCFLIEKEKTIEDCSLEVPGLARFNIRDISPYNPFDDQTIYIFDDRTDLSIFVPHEKGSVDMVVVIDGSGSMDLKDYVGEDERPHPRLVGVRNALTTLVERRLKTATRISKIAFVVFGRNSLVLYPLITNDMIELDNELIIAELFETIKKTTGNSLKRLGVDRRGTKISQAIELAADLLIYHASEGNEKIILLLSDGADWTEQSDRKTLGEAVLTSDDPPTLADDLYYVEQIRIHTIAISDKEALIKFEPQYRDDVTALPNPELLKKISDNSHAKFFPNPDANTLSELFDYLGEGMLYPI